MIGIAGRRSREDGPSGGAGAEVAPRLFARPISAIVFVVLCPDIARGIDFRREI